MLNFPYLVRVVLVSLRKILSFSPYKSKKILLRFFLTTLKILIYGVNAILKVHF